ncbi:MAG: NAD(P)-dependent glycerol-3-phosphate dehydrogenase [Actinomycetota bacterium]|nr:NAD(P)-dependent glycerol-3-phosphate dehydrogenase [Actinomycetota bacterium]
MSELRASVIGAGSWGTAVAVLLGSKGIATTLWARSDEVAEGIRDNRRNPRYFPEVVLPNSVCSTTDIEEAVTGADVIVVATPSQGVRDIAERFAPFRAYGVPVVSLAKGLEQGTLFRMTEVLAEVTGERGPMATLSGPNHAEEVSRGIPSTTVIAANDPAVGVLLRDFFLTPTFRVYTNNDVVGVELCGASKNVVAVAAGISDGIGYGDNTKASLMTRGLAEMSRLGRHLGANPLTYMGLAGMGDLIATCTSRHSRNRALGEHVAGGGSMDSYYEKTHMVAEGAISAVTVDEMAARHGVELPITHQVRSVLYEGVAPASAVDALMTRTATDELHGMDLIDD